MDFDVYVGGFRSISTRCLMNLCGFRWNSVDFDGFRWISWIPGVEGLSTCGNLWQPVATCGGLKRQAATP